MTESKTPKTPKTPKTSKAPKTPSESVALAITAGPGARLSRQQVADLFGYSIRSVGRMDGDQLHPHEEAGRVWYDAAEAALVAASIRASASTTAEVVDVAPTAQGRLASRVFQAFAQGKTPSQVVIELGLEPGVVKQLYLAWVDLEGGVFIPPSHWRVLRALFPSMRTPSDLVSMMKTLLAAYHELQRFKFPCCVCGEPVQATSSGVCRALLDGSRLAIWGHGDCVDRGDNE
jgi:hypothetical protein